MIIADTDVLIDFLSAVEPMTARVAALLESRTLRTTVITRFELLSGARTPRQTKAIHDLLAAVPSLPLQSEEADRAARLRHDLDRQGAAIGMADSLIAGIVLAHGGKLLTRNQKHFTRVPGLKLESVE
ncbi:MAG: type II toxin-antitoxin system VapC family toxin [Bryobacteraceae bacterium]